MHFPTFIIRSARLWTGMLVLVALLFCASVSVAVETIPTDKVQVGFDGHSRLGSWFPVFVQYESDDKGITYEVDSFDADGFPVTITGTPTRHADGWVECLMQVGRKHGRCQLRLMSEVDAVLAQTSFRLNDTSNKRTVHPSTQGLTVVVEPDQSIASTLRSQSRTNRSADSPIVSISDSNWLPASWLGWQCVDTLILSAADVQRLKQVTPGQWDAIDQWSRRGGRLILSIGPAQANELSGDGGLSRFCPGKYAGDVQVESSSRIEFFAQASEQLIPRGGDPLSVCRLEEVQGRVELPQDSVPLIISSARGFGEQVFVAFDLNNQRLTGWKGFSGLISRIVQGSADGDVAPKRKRSGAHGNRVSHVGYTDMTGQLRRTLDRFPSVAFISFASIATLIGLYILCIGPGDYFFLRKIARRMEFTWLTFPLMSLLFCGAAIYVAKAARPASIKLNQLEIIDIDQTSGLVRGNLWTHSYSPAGGRRSIALPTNNAICGSLDQAIVGWQGLPGAGLGGMETRAANSLLGQGYQQLVDKAIDSDELQISIADQQLRVSATQALFSQWWSKNPPEIESDLRLNRRTRHIEGTFVNPLDQPLKNCRLLFGDYSYSLPDRLNPGDEIDILGDDLREQTTRSFLNRRTKDSEDSNRSQSEPWDPTSTGIDRLGEIFMFYSAAGGQEYTGLSHDYQPFVDLSNHLQLSRAILVGELPEPITSLEIDGQPATEQYDSATTFVRIIFPVGTR